ncbi:MAG: nuclear transport factor 2 family protein [Bacteroidales bacterium]|nr:MAG: nuclear transport factor 2 family protein [Bacteroidales bacterium]
MDKLFSEQNMALSIFDAMNTRDFSKFENFITESVVFDFPGAGRIEGYKRVIIFLKALLRKYPELKFTVTEIITDNQRACAVWTNKGEDINGNTYSNSGITLLYFTGNKITFISDYFKDTSFVKP